LQFLIIIVKREEIDKVLEGIESLDQGDLFMTSRSKKLSDLFPNFKIIKMSNYSKLSIIDINCR